MQGGLLTSSQLDNMNSSQVFDTYRVVTCITKAGSLLLCLFNCRKCCNITLNESRRLDSSQTSVIYEIRDILAVLRGLPLHIKTSF